MKTLKAFKEYCGSTLAALIVPVKNQTGHNLPGFWNELGNVSESPCGAAGGYTGFIYYIETAEFWRKNRKKIRAYMDEMAWELGEDTLNMCLSFGGIKGNFDANEVGCALYDNYNENLMQIYNVFSWFILEEIAYKYNEWCYENDYNKFE